MTDINEVDQDDDIDPADLWAEIDEEPDGEYADDENDEDIDDDFETFTGTARGGPLDGRSVESRFPKGFLLIDMENERLWLYDRRDDGDFHVRSDTPASLADDGDDNRWRAADEEDYDILVPDMATADDEGDDGGDA